MSSDLSLIRANLTKIPSALKQGNLLSAAQAMRKGVQTLYTKNLLRTEIDELVRLCKQASAYLADAGEIKKLFPLSLEYTKGDEEQYLATLDELIDMLQNNTSHAAFAKVEEMKNKKEAEFVKGQGELQQGRYDQARVTFTDLKNEYSGDTILINEIAQSFMDVNMNDDAASFLKEALNYSPNNIHTLNKLGVTLRKLKLFEESEKIFNKALSLDDGDPYLYFNFARLYLDWKKYAKGLSLAEEACRLLPDFQEAQKMRAYLQKQLDASAER